MEGKGKWRAGFPRVWCAPFPAGTPRTALAYVKLPPTPLAPAVKHGMYMVARMRMAISTHKTCYGHTTQPRHARVAATGWEVGV